MCNGVIRNSSHEILGPIPNLLNPAAQATIALALLILLAGSRAHGRVLTSRRFRQTGVSGPGRAKSWASGIEHFWY